MAGVNWKNISRIIENQAIASLGNGQTIKIIEPSSRYVDPTQPQDGFKSTTTTHVAKAVGVGIKSSDKPQPSDESKVVRKLLLGASSLSVRPRIGWKVLMDVDGETDVSHRIIAPLNETKPGDTTVVWSVFVER